MTRCGFLLIDRDYFVPYVNWIVKTYNEGKFEISGFFCDSYERFDRLCPGFSELPRKTFDEIVETSDIVFSLGYWKKISKESIEKAKLGIVNVHHSYRLKYKGRHTCTHAIQNNERVHGSTLHYIDEKIDVGEIIDSRACEITSTDTAFTLLHKVNEIGLQLLSENFSRLLEGKVECTIKHDEHPFSYRERDIKHELDRNLLNSPNDLGRFIRSLTFPNTPKPYMVINDQKFFFTVEDDV